MNRVKIRLSLWAFLALGCALSVNTAASAQDATFQQQITPIYCQISNTDNGTFTSTSVTPNSCINIIQQVEGASIIAEQQKSGTSLSGNQSEPNQNIAKLPYKPIVTLGKSTRSSYHIDVDLVLAVSGGVLGLLVIIAVLAILL